MHAYQNYTKSGTHCACAIFGHRHIAKDRNTVSRMVVPFAPGGASDFVARILQPSMSKQGYDRVVGSWQGVYVPKGTAPGVVDVVSAAKSGLMHPR